MRITIVNDGDGAPAAAGGLGLGLENVRARLALVYGQAAQLTAGPRSPQGYAVRLDLPLHPSTVEA
jgi:LytS/YehU family sensor histidine kinase